MNFLVRLRFGTHFLLWLQNVGTESIDAYWCAVHAVRQLNHFVDTLNLVAVLRHDAKAFQIIVFSDSFKKQNNRTDGRQFTGKSSKEISG